MRRLALIAVALGAGAAALGAGPASGGAEPYEVRAAFDTAAFLVPGEEVRIAGARVGTVAEVEVSGPDEVVSLRGGGSAVPGKAIVVMRIDDPAFRDFRTDASCLIRPQSLLGEKFVECVPAQPRAPGAAPPPPLEPIAEGEPGAGQRLLALERNGKAVDLDLVQNIQRLPYAERLRLILNDLGAGLAARGPELARIVERSNPALRQADRVLAILARQSRALARLARDADTVLAPLARERASVGGFISGAGEVAGATAERRAELEAALELLPGALRELRLTMGRLRAFGDAATPVLGSLGAAAPDLGRATRAVPPLARTATPALRTLGDAARAAGPKLAASDPLLVDLRTLGERTKPAAAGLRDLLASLRETGGTERLMDFLFYTVGATNGFDSYGHFLRALLIVTNCNDYEVRPIGGCEANFSGRFSGAAAAAPRPAARGAASRRAGRALVRFLLDDGSGAGGTGP